MFFSDLCNKITNIKWNVTNFYLWKIGSSHFENHQFLDRLISRWHYLFKLAKLAVRVCCTRVLLLNSLSAHLNIISIQPSCANWSMKLINYNSAIYLLNGSIYFAKLYLRFERRRKNDNTRRQSYKINLVLKKYKLVLNSWQCITPICITLQCCYDLYWSNAPATNLNFSLNKMYFISLLPVFSMCLRRCHDSIMVFVSLDRSDLNQLHLLQSFDVSVT